MSSEQVESTGETPEMFTSGSDAFSSVICSTVNSEDLQFSLQYQQAALEKLRKCSSDLRAFNDANGQELAKMGRELERYAKMDKQMKNLYILKYFQKLLIEYFEKLHQKKIIISKKIPSI